MVVIIAPPNEKRQKGLLRLQKIVTEKNEVFAHDILSQVYGIEWDTPEHLTHTILRFEKVLELSRLGLRSALDSDNKGQILQWAILYTKSHELLKELRYNLKQSDD